MGKREALKALTLTIGATPESDLVSRSTEAVSEIVTTRATIFKHVPARTLWLPRATHTMTPPVEPLFSPVGPVFPPTGTADTTPALSPAVYVLLFSFAFVVGTLFSLLFAGFFLRRVSRDCALRSDGTPVIQAGHSEKSTVNSIWDGIIDWSNAYSLEVVEHTLKLQTQVDDLESIVRGYHI